MIHGRQTLSYASAVAAHFIANSARVVFTGSQYPLLNVQGTDTREFSDAISNLNFALDAVVKHPVGVYLGFSSTGIACANRRKTTYHRTGCFYRRHG